MPQPPPAPRSNRNLLIVIIILLVLILAGGTIPVIGILAAIAIPNFVVMQYRAKRAELPLNVDGIKTAEMAYDAAFDMYLEIPTAVPVDPMMVGRMPHDWPSGTPFDDLGWAPYGQLRGTYWVELSPDGSDFTVHGVCDVDGDGDPAHYTATRTENATLLSYSNVY